MHFKKKTLRFRKDTSEKKRKKKKNTNLTEPSVENGN